GRPPGLRRRAALRRLRPAPGDRPPVRVRRHRGALRGERVRRHRVGQPPRRHGHQDELPARPRPGRGRRPRHQRPVPRRRRGRRHRRPRPRARHLPRRRHDHGRGLPAPAGQRGGRPLPCPRRAHVAAGQHDHDGHHPDDARRFAPMSMPFYVAPEQWMKDKADFARKGIARGRALAALMYEDGILTCAEHSLATLRQISEVYGPIASPGSAKYNEYDRLRIAGVRHADLKGYAFSREDVDAQSLANAYAQMLGDVFTHEAKPMEVEILVAEVGDEPSDDRLFHILYDGTVVDEHGFTVLGGEADTISARLKESYTAGRSLVEAVRTAVAALAGPERTLEPKDLEVAVL